MLDASVSTKKTPRKQRFQRIWLFFFIFLLVIGVFFRFINLDRKVYWNDEAYTLLHLSGYKEAEVVQQEYNGRFISPAELYKYQRLNPDKTILDTVKTLETEDTQHPPLYYGAAYLWAKWFGSSIGVIRALSALLSLLVFPAIYWLCWELFQSSLIGWLAISLIAVSPFHLLYAQEARQYSFWTATILLSSASFLRAIRLQTVTSWAIYTVTLCLGFYTFLLSVLVAIGHGVYLALISRFRITKTLITYLLALLGGILLYTPWLLVLVNNLGQIHKTTQWVESGNLAVPEFLKTLISSFSQIFFNISSNECIYDPNSHVSEETIENFIKYPIFILISYSIYFLCRKAPIRAWLLILILIGTTALPFISLDLIEGGARSVTPRYMIPSYLGISLSMAYLLASSFDVLRQKVWQKRLWRSIAVILITVGIISCVEVAQAKTWWNKYTDSCIPWVARVINTSRKPLLIAHYNPVDTDLGHTLTLNNLLDQKVQLSLVTGSELPHFSGQFSHVFLYRFSNKSLEAISKNHKIEPVNGYEKLYRLIYSYD